MSRSRSHSRGRFPRLIAAALLALLPAASRSADFPTPAPDQPAVQSDTVAPIPPTPTLPPEARQAAEDGINAMAKNKFDLAETSFQKLLKLSPDNLSAIVNLGLVEFRLGHMSDAMSYFQRAIALKSDAGLPWMMLGVIDQSKKDSPAATAELAMAVYLEPKNPQAHNYFGATLAARGWDSAAEDEFQRAVELNPNFGDAQFNLAVCYLTRVPPAYELARRHYQKALDLGEPPDPLITAKLKSAPPPVIPP